MPFLDRTLKTKSNSRRKDSPDRFLKLLNQSHKKPKYNCNSKTPSRQGHRVKKLKLNLKMKFDRGKKHPFLFPKKH